MLAKRDGSPSGSSIKGKLLYRIAAHNGGLVLATEDRARCVARIHEAIRTSRTWADFRHAMPRREYSTVLRILDEQCEPRPKGGDAFSGEMLPGWTDGDYPPWLQAEMSTLIPNAILTRFGKRKVTHHNGSFWWIPPEATGAICAELSAAGWTVEHAPDLPFW
jgi:hypothetical protein